MKYIDAEKLVAEIERMREVNRKAFMAEHITADVFHGRAQAVNHLSSIIDSLQEEQPEVDLVAELKHHLATTPKEQLEKEWKELEPWSIIGPTVQEFLYGKQPEVDFKIEERKWIHNAVDNVFPEDGDFMSEIDFRKILKDTARHFFNLGLNARKV